MGKLRDLWIETAIKEKRWPLLLIVLLGIPAFFPIIDKYYIKLPTDDPQFQGMLWIFNGVVCIVSGGLDWVLMRRRRRQAWLSGLLAIVGIIPLVVGIVKMIPPPPPKDRLVVAIADFASFDGADGRSFKETLIEKLDAKILDEKAPLAVKRIEAVIEDSAGTEANQMALKLGRYKGAHLVLWGKIRKKTGPDGKAATRVGPHLTFCAPVQAVRIDETDVGGFNKAEPDTLGIEEEEYAKNIAQMVAFISGLAYYKAQEWNLAKEAFDKSPISAAILYGGLCLYNRSQKSTSPEDDLRGAITIFQSLIDSHSEHPIDGDDEVTRAACLDRASALATLSRFSPEEALERLQQAKEAYRQALECCPKDKSPLEWAMAQSDLGSVLTDLALMTGDVTGQLEEAIERHEKALEVYSAVSPKGDSDVAITQRNLGTAYYHLGFRLNGDRAENYLSKAASSFQAALQVLTRNNSPRTWATISIYMAGALAELGSRQGERGDQRASENNLRQAVDRCRNAVSVFKERDDDWAQAKANLASVLYLQGKRKNGDAGNKLLREAIEESQNALTVYEEGSLNWAVANKTLGSCLSELGTRTPGNGGETLLHDAIEAYQASMRLRDQEEHNENWAKTLASLGTAQAELGKRKEGDERANLFSAAITNFRLALGVYDEDHYREQYSDQRNNLSNRIQEIDH